MPLKAELEAKIGQSTLHFWRKSGSAFFKICPNFFHFLPSFFGPKLGPSGSPFGPLRESHLATCPVAPNRASLEDREPTLTDPSFAKLEKVASCAQVQRQLKLKRELVQDNFRRWSEKAEKFLKP